MARVLPFSALLPSLESHLSADDDGCPFNAPPRSSFIRPLLDRVDPTAELGRLRAAGSVLRDTRPALYLAEVYSPAGGLGGPPVRFLLCALTPDAAEPLEAEPYRPRSAQVEPAVTLAADDHGVLRALLAEAAERSSTVWQGTFDDAPVSLRRIEPSPVARRIQAVLDEAPLRPLAELDERRPSLAAIVPLSDPGLHFEPVHRALQGLETFEEETFLALVTAYARIYDLEEPLTTPRGVALANERLTTLVRGHHAVLLVLPGGRGKILRFRQGLDLAHLKGAPRNPTLRSLDLALLNALVLRTVLGIQDPEDPGHPQVFAVQGLDSLVRGVHSGTFQVGFALNPPPLWEVRAVMEAAQCLPPKTLRVEPAPPAGLLFLDPEA
ncbi:DUF1015 family protein [Archangium sp.]|uniref:DUF1015 family protein n=1 Tax=Archangium sp. TaxID=1872627 RepID=UPI002D464CC2|nr:DUF1015 family protein [Archangium sp.]HYO55807.1 DUF1015 family protein [Archangium sp.]